MHTSALLPAIERVFDGLNLSAIPEERLDTLDLLVGHIARGIDQQEAIQLNFICTHNSRRSQLAQIWCTVAAHFYKLPVDAYSGGVEITACHPNTIRALHSQGFEIPDMDGDNPVYPVRYSEVAEPLELYSKTYDDERNPQADFIAIMTCGHANEHCPIIAGSDLRIPLTYRDPKESDGRPEQDAVYVARSLEIATEMKYIFQSLSQEE